MLVEQIQDGTVKNIQFLIGQSINSLSFWLGSILQSQVNKSQIQIYKLMPTCQFVNLQHVNYAILYTIQYNNRFKLITIMQDDPFAIFSAPKRANQSTNQENHQIRKQVHIDQSNNPHQSSMNILQKQMLLEIGQQNQSDNENNQANKSKLDEIQIQMQREDEGCLHEVFYPKDYIRKEYHGNHDAKRYKFKLDPFQQKSVHAIQMDQSVLVCAHTSAGKTAIAQYAIAYSLKNKSRVIYTSPIKALSNQKYRQLKDQFQDVGLITGDVTIDQNATCLVMTTQILRNMIYRGSQIVRQVKWVIFDQVHYMRDKERGVVWEQTIIMLPSNVRYVFLSATIGNPEQFATWITKLRKQPCNVVYTDFRPVPLEHYLCPANGQGLFMVVDDKGKFHDDNFNKAMQTMGQTVNIIGLDTKKKKKGNQGSDLFKIIKIVMQRNLDPVIIFSFSKKDVEAYAKSVCTKYDLTTKAQKERIQQVFNNSIDVLDKIDSQLPQIKALKQIIKKGIGIHHGGLLPLLKEVVELLFQDGLIKVLFSTQTFSMGLNMPAKTVIFTSVKKFDGQKSRWITGGQYIQMSGRAGRRGLDKKGMTILMLDEKMQPNIAKDMLKGKSDDLLSSFYINYNMLLNSQRLQDIDSDYILSRSLLQFQHQAKLPKIIQQHKKKVAECKQIKLQNQKDLQDLYLLHQREKQYKKKLRQFSFIPKNVIPYMNIGRVVRMIDGQKNWGLGICLNFHRKDMKKNTKTDHEIVYLFDIMVYGKPRDPNSTISPEPANLDQDGDLVVLTFSLPCIYQITTMKIATLPAQLTSQASKKLIHQTLLGLSQKKLTLINLQTNDPKTTDLRKLLKNTQEQIQNLKEFQKLMPQYAKKRKLYKQLQDSAKNLKSMSGIVLRKQKKSYYRVMKRTGLIQKSVVTLKGNVACQISSNHEVLLTDLLLSGYFNDMTPIEMASILTSLVHQQKSSTERKITKNPRLRFKLQELLTYAKKMYQTLHQCKVSIEQDEYLDSIKEQLIQVCYEWCNGANFADLCKMTDTYQGSIIRTFRRLNQLLKQMANASKIIGNQELGQKFQQAATKVFRGIVFAASLYTL